eukprot:TRINITY_DN1380_c1_g1_i4.p1 TRINITY_DN1380_c1_g1~~TRINITY_DN1380_c1_g1_i4.p1  ORF type:complete len:203 (+),score=34.65 TRINITY_DN1380_c1_g1_i4:165-773(+)
MSTTSVLRKYLCTCLWMVVSCGDTVRDCVVFVFVSHSLSLSLSLSLSVCLSSTLAGSIPYPDKYDDDPRIYMKNTTVETFLKGMSDGDPWILFDARMHRKAPQFLKDYVTLPPFRMCGEASPPQFSLGGYPAGAPFHSHVHAWNALIYGRKRWFMVPPGLNTAHHVDTNRPSERTLSWLEKGGLEDYKSKGIMYVYILLLAV